MYDTITKYNGQNHTTLSNVKIREAINKVMKEEQEESNNVMVDTFRPQRNKSDNIINQVTNFTKNDV